MRGRVANVEGQNFGLSTLWCVLRQELVLSGSDDLIVQRLHGDRHEGFPNGLLDLVAVVGDNSLQGFIRARVVLEENFDLIIDLDSLGFTKLLDSVDDLSGGTNLSQLIIDNGADHDSRVRRSSATVLLALGILILEGLLDSEPVILDDMAVDLKLLGFLEESLELIRGEGSELLLKVFVEIFLQSTANDSVIGLSLVGDVLSFILDKSDVDAVQLLLDVVADGVEVLESLGIIVDDDNLSHWDLE